MTVEALLLLLIFLLLFVDTVLAVIAVIAAWRLSSEVQRLQARLTVLLDRLERDSTDAIREYASLARDVRGVLQAAGSALGGRVLRAAAGAGSGRNLAVAGGLVAGLRAAQRLYQWMAGRRSNRPGDGNRPGAGAA